MTRLSCIAMLSAVVILNLCSSTLMAQLPSTPNSASSSARAAFAPLATEPKQSGSRRAKITIGAVIGAIAGGIAGYHLEAATCSGCDFGPPLYTAAAVGALLGGLVGGGLTAIATQSASARLEKHLAWNRSDQSRMLWLQRSVIGTSALRPVFIIETSDSLPLTTQLGRSLTGSDRSHSP